MTESSGTPAGDDARSNDETRGWIFSGLQPEDGIIPWSEGDPERQAMVAAMARAQRDPVHQARMARWRASMRRGEPAAALVAGPLPHEADAIVIRDLGAAEPRLLVLTESTLSAAHITLARSSLTLSEMRVPDVEGRMEIALWLDGRLRITHPSGRVKTGTRDWRYVGGPRPEKVRELLDRVDPTRSLELSGIGVARVAPSYLYPRRLGP